jgi:outer membrane protein W
MKSSRLAVAVAVLVLTAVPTFAAERFFDIKAYASWVDFNSSGTFNATPAGDRPVDINFDPKQGWGAAANIFLGRNFSLEVAGTEVRPEASFGPAAGTNFQGGDLKMLTLTGIVQFHFAPRSMFDPYIGAGAAYVLFDDLKDARDINDIHFSQIDFKDDAGLALNAGLDIGLTPHFGIVIDGKYVPIRSSATANFAGSAGSGSTRTDIKSNPVILSGGVSFRF